MLIIHWFCSFYSQVGETGKAIGIDHIEELVNMSIANVKKDAALSSLLASGRMKLLTGDGRLGYEGEAPYDAIHVGAAAAEIPQAVRFSLHPSVFLILN